MLKYLGKDKKPFLLSYSAFKEFEKLQSKSKEVEMYELFAYCGFKSGHQKESKEFTATPEEMADWFDEELELFTLVLEEVGEALPKYKEAQKKMVLTMVKLKGQSILEETVEENLLKQNPPVESKKTAPGKKSKK